MSAASPDFDAPPPPDSWPGAAGRRSVAPEVPAWPGAALRSSGDSWPGARRGTQAPRRLPRPSLEPGEGGVAGVLFPAIAVIVLVTLIGVWVLIAPEQLMAQLAALVIVLVGAAGALIVSLVRGRR